MRERILKEHVRGLEEQYLTETEVFNMDINCT